MVTGRWIGLGFDWIGWRRTGHDLGRQVEYLHTVQYAQQCFQWEEGGGQQYAGMADRQERNLDGWGGFSFVEYQNYFFYTLLGAMTISFVYHGVHENVLWDTRT